jgi:hypothetical protein
LTQYTVRRVDKSSTAVTVLASSDKFTTSVGYTFADDNYFVLAADRMDLSTLEVKPLVSGYSGQSVLAAGDLFLYPGGLTSDNALVVVHVATATRSNLLTDYMLFPRSMAATPSNLFVAVSFSSYGSGTPSSLVRIVLP